MCVSELPSTDQKRALQDMPPIPKKVIKPIVPPKPSHSIGSISTIASFDGPAGFPRKGTSSSSSGRRGRKAVPSPYGYATGWQPQHTPSISSTSQHSHRPTGSTSSHYGETPTTSHTDEWGGRIDGGMPTSSSGSFTHHPGFASGSINSERHYLPQHQQLSLIHI